MGNSSDSSHALGICEYILKDLLFSCEMGFVLILKKFKHQTDETVVNPASPGPDRMAARLRSPEMFL